MNDIQRYLKLGQIVNFQNGYAFKSKEYTTKGHYLIRIKNVQQGYIEIDDECYVTLPEEERFQKFNLKEKDIVLSLTGNVGRIARLGKEHLPAALNQRVASVTPKNSQELDADYLYYLLRSPNFLKFAINSGKGAAQQNISTSDLEEYPVRILSLENQIKTVKKLENALSEVELLQTNLMKRQAKVLELRESILNAAFSLDGVTL